MDVKDLQIYSISGPHPTRITSNTLNPHLHSTYVTYISRITLETYPVYLGFPRSGFHSLYEAYPTRSTLRRVRAFRHVRGCYIRIKGATHASVTPGLLWVSRWPTCHRTLTLVHRSILTQGVMSQLTRRGPWPTRDLSTVLTEQFRGQWVDQQVQSGPE